jgi:kynurenine formamidase
MSLDALLAELRSCDWIDLTHPFAPGIPHYGEFPDEEREIVFGLAPGEGSLGDGFLVHRYTHVGQWGTHVDPPSHFIAGGRPLDRLPVTEMILPLAVLDVREQVAASADFAATDADVRADEERHGRVPTGAFVALLTGWGARWPDPAATDNRDADGICHAPGWDTSALRLLLEERGAVAVGHDVTSTDPAALVDAGRVPAETYVLARDRWQIELLANLDRVPPRGALIVATWPAPAGGSGFPARCFAIAPRSRTDRA